MEPVCSPITRPSSPMQLIAGLYKGLFISQRATKGALSKFSLGLLNHHSRQDQQSITWMCQNTASFPQTHLLHPSISPQRVRGDGWHVPAKTELPTHRALEWGGSAGTRHLRVRASSPKCWCELSEASGNPPCTPKMSHKHQGAGGAPVVWQLNSWSCST